LGREPASIIIRPAAQAPCRWRPLSSNVRRHLNSLGLVCWITNRLRSCMEPVRASLWRRRVSGGHSWSVGGAAGQCSPKPSVRRYRPAVRSVSWRGRTL